MDEWTQIALRFLFHSPVETFKRGYVTVEVLRASLFAMSGIHSIRKIGLMQVPKGQY
jgi:hypothetical protein